MRSTSNPPLCSCVPICGRVERHTSLQRGVETMLLFVHKRQFILFRENVDVLKVLKVLDVFCMRESYAMTGFAASKVERFGMKGGEIW